MFQTNRIFRIFVSSTFKDMMVERDALQKRVFPRLRKLCESHGTRFQAVDLRWGVSVQAQRNQQTMPLCIGEIKRSREISPRPHFIFLLGQRYGWVPLPAAIPAGEFDQLKPVKLSDKELMDQWYVRDDNAVPPVYRLQPRTITGVNLGDPGWADAQAREESQWAGTETRLRVALSNAATAAGLGGNTLTRYSASATEQEIIAALFDPEAAPDAVDHVFGFMRATEGPDDAPIAKLKKKLQETLPAEHLITYNPITDQAESLAAFCDAVFTALRSVIEVELQGLAKEDPLDMEIRTHFEFGRDRRQAFIGRKKALRSLSRYLRKGKAAPLVVHGEAGSGKTAFMAEARQLVSARQNDTVIVERYIGATPASTQGRLLLSSLCSEIDRNYDTGPVALPETYPELVKAFRKRLELAAKTRPLFIFIDALDQFVRDDPALALDWLPSELPAYARVIVSVAPSPLLDTLTPRLDRKQFLEVGDLPVKEAARLLDRWFEESNRTLQPHQEAIVLAGFQSCPRPLYLKLAAEEARKWVSADHPASLPLTLEGMISAIFDRLASDVEHGAVMVAHSLSYLAAARNGLTEDEILDILSMDKAVVSDLLRRSPNSPRVDRLPPVVWSRLRADLDPFLVQRVADGTSLLGFYHRTVTDTIQKRYPGPDPDGWHGLLADYFGSKAIVVDNVPNQRVLSELPHQLMSAGRRDELENTLTNYHFLYYKNLVSGPQAIVDDCASADRMGCGTSGIDGIEEAMRLSTTVVAKYPEQLPGQLTGRLSGYTNPAVAALVRSIPRLHEGPWLRPMITPMAQPGGPLLRTLDTGQDGVNAMSASSDGMLVVTAGRDGSIALWDIASGRELHRMYGHEQEIRNIALSPDGGIVVSVSYSEVGILDLNAGRRLHMIDMGRSWPGPAAILDERWAMVGSVDSTISLIDMVAGKVVRRLKGHANKIESLDAWGDFAVSADDRHMIVWSTEALRRGAAGWAGRSVIHTIDTTGEGYPGGRLLVAVGDGGRTAITLRGDESGSCMLWDLESGKIKRRFPNIPESFGYRVGASRDQDCFVVGMAERSTGQRDRYGNYQLYIINNSQITAKVQVESVWGIAVSADGMTAFTGGDTVSVWDLDAIPSGVLADEIPSLSAVDISEKTGTVIGSDDEGWLVKIHSVSGSIERVGKAAGGVVDLAVSDDESTMLAVLEDGEVEVWVEGARKRTIAVPGVIIQTVDITADGREAVGAGRERSSLFSNECRWRWDVATGDIINHSMDTSRCLVLARKTGEITFSQSIFVTSGSRTVGLRNRPEGSGITWVQALAVDGSGDRIAAATAYYRMEVWDTNTREQVAELALSDVKTGEHENIGGAVALWLSPDGKWCLAALSDKTVMLWEVSADRPIAVYTLDAVPSWVGAAEDGSIIVVKDESGGLYTFKIEGVSMDIEISE